MVVGAVMADGMRTMHLIDVENLGGGARTDDVVGPLRDYWSAAPYADGDIVVIAANPGLMAEIAFEVHDLPCVLRCRRGTDGADRALLEAAPHDVVTRGFDRLVVGSGDHIFTDLVASVAADGVETVVIARTDSLARRLQFAADMVVRLDPLDDGPSASVDRRVDRAA